MAQAKTFIHQAFQGDAEVRTWVQRLEHDFDLQGEELYRNGRNVLKLHSLASGQTLVVKQFRLRSAWRRLLALLSRRMKGRKAFEGAMALQQEGFHTPQPVAWVEVRRHGIPHCSFYVSQFTADEPVLPLLERDSPDTAMVEAFADLLAQMHQRGIVHHDTNLSNILYHEEEGHYVLSLIDTNRIGYTPGRPCPLWGRGSGKADLMRFTGRLHLFLDVAYRYAQRRGLPAEPFVRRLTVAKIRHDANWTRRKRWGL